MEKEKPHTEVLSVYGLEKPDHPLALSIFTRDGKLVIEAPLDQIAAQVARRWENPVKVFDQKTFGDYLAEYLKRRDHSLLSIRDQIEEAATDCIDDAGEVRAGIRAMSEDASMLVEWMWEQRDAPLEYYPELEGKSLHELVCEAAIAAERGENNQAIDLLCKPWRCDFGGVLDKPGEVISANTRDSIETATLLYAKRSEP